MGIRARMVHAPPRVGLGLTQLVGLLKGDVALTGDEVAGLLTSKAAPTGTTTLADWLIENRDGLGRKYVSELGRNFRLYRSRAWDECTWQSGDCKREGTDAGWGRFRAV